MIDRYDERMSAVLRASANTPSNHHEKTTTSQNHPLPVQHSQHGPEFLRFLRDGKRSIAITVRASQQGRAQRQRQAQLACARAHGDSHIGTFSDAFPFIGRSETFAAS